MRIRHLATLCIGFLFSLSAFANHHYPNCILVTIDGVRPQEFFQGVSGSGTDLTLEEDQLLMPFFWHELAPRGRVLGQDKSFQIVAQTPISLPSYRSIFTGRGIDGSNTDRFSQDVDTVFDEVIRRLDLTFSQVASIASWERIAFALNTTHFFINTGQHHYPHNRDNSTLALSNREQFDNPPPWMNARYDRYTRDFALDYLQVHQPRLMHIGFNDTDDEAHNGEWEHYLQGIRDADAFLRELTGFLEAHPFYRGQTTVIVTTDHGRGIGEQWRDHGPTIAESEYAWFYASGPKIPADGIVTIEGASHAVVRPMILEAMGVERSEEGTQVARAHGVIH